MALQAESNYRLRWMDFDRRGHLQPWALLDLFQDMATVHAEQLGIGRDDTMKHGVFWVVVRTKYELLREPSHNQVVTVRTWPHSLSRFSFIRDFYLLDEEGEVLARATQEWVLMDAVERKFASAREYYDGPEDFSEDRAFPKKPRKVPPFAETNRDVRTVVPALSDIDVNGHVNNAMYAKFVTDSLDPDEDRPIKSMQIDYRLEALLGEPLKVHVLEEGDTALVRGERENGDVSFASLVEFGARQDS